MYKLFVTTLLLLSLAPMSLSAQPDLNAAKVDRNVVFGMYSGRVCHW